MVQFKCKFCGDACRLRKYGDHELAICGPCFKSWKRMVET